MNGAQTRPRTWGATVALALVTAMGACSSSPSSPSIVGFQGQVQPLAGLSVYTGAQPGPGSATVELTVTGNGSATAALGAVVSDGQFVGVAGTGVYSVTANFALAGRVHASGSGSTFDAALTGLSKLAIPVTGRATFDPLLTDEGQTATVTTAIAPVSLGSVPLGTVPGQLGLSVADGSSFVSSFGSACVTIANGTAHYVAETVTSGTLVLDGTLTVGAPYNQTVHLTNLTISIPDTTEVMDLGTQPAAGVADGVLGVCPSSADAGVHDAGASDGQGPSQDATTHPDSSDAPSYTISATVDGTMLTASHVVAFSDATDCGPGGYSVSLYFTGPGLGPNTFFGMCLTSVTAGCLSQTLEYQPDDGSGATYFDDGTSTCGLQVSNLPPGNITGSFNGMLTDYSGPTTITVMLAFDTPLTQ